MNIDRRQFLALSAVGLAGCAIPETKAVGTDENLTVFVTDIHVGGGDEGADRPLKRLEAFVSEVLAMNPRPKRVVSLGDLAYLRGLPADYARSKPALKRLEAAGVELVFCMGNHDRRSAFHGEWPEQRVLSSVPGRYVRVVPIGTADLVVLDCLQGADDRPADDSGPGSGLLHPDVLAWAMSELPTRRRPFFVCSHFPIGELSLPAAKPGGRPTPFASWLLRKAPQCVGYLHGHDHRWRPEWSKESWGSPQTLRTLCLPSNGLWGDIGHAVFRTYEDRAVCTLEIRDFFFPREPETGARPLAWRVKVEENAGQKVTFVYDGRRQ